MEICESSLCGRVVMFVVVAEGGRLLLIIIVCSACFVFACVRVSGHRNFLGIKKWTDGRLRQRSLSKF